MLEERLLFKPEVIIVLSSCVWAYELHFSLSVSWGKSARNVFKFLTLGAVFDPPFNPYTGQRCQQFVSLARPIQARIQLLEIGKQSM